MKRVKVISKYRIPKYTGLKESFDIDIPENWHGGEWGLLIGYIGINQVKESYFDADKINKDTLIFDQLREDVELIEKKINIGTNEDTHFVNAYYIPFYIYKHSSTQPAASLKGVYQNSRNDKLYYITYELGFVTNNDYKRYITFRTEVKANYNSVIMNLIQDINVCLSQILNLKSPGFEFIKNMIAVSFYNNIGHEIVVKFNNIDELSSLLASIRVIGCED